MRTTRPRTCIGNGRLQHMSELHDNAVARRARGICALRALVIHVNFDRAWAGHYPVTLNKIHACIFIIGQVIMSV